MIKEEFEKFKNHKSVKRWSVDVFDKTKWSTGSWFTLQRTLRKSKEHKENGKLYEKLREDCKKYIFDEIFNFFPEEIDEIDWIDITDNEFAEKETSKNSKQLLRRLHVKDGEDVLQGAEAFLSLWKKIPFQLLLGAQNAEQGTQLLKYLLLLFYLICLLRQLVWC